jgi:RNA polymerase sigma-70 factor (ECF subfamily)
MLNCEPEHELVQRAVAGDRTALSQLLLLHYDGLVRRISARITPDLQGLIRADDILQMTFIRAAHAIRLYEPRGPHSFRSWLRAIADNLLLDVRRRRQREARWLKTYPPVAQHDNSSPTPLAEQIGADQTSPSRRARLAENVQRMLAAVNRLPDEHREVIRRRYLDGETWEQIACDMGHTKEAVRGLCYRARQQLRAKLGGSSLYFSG